MPQARVRTSTSPGPGSGAGTSRDQELSVPHDDGAHDEPPSRPRGRGALARGHGGGEVRWDRVVDEPHAADDALLGVVDIALVIGPTVDVETHRVLLERSGIGHGVDVGGPVDVAGPASTAEPSGSSRKGVREASR